VTPEERFEQIERNLHSASERMDMLIKIHLDNDGEYRERLDRLEGSIVELRNGIVELRNGISDLRIASAQDGENIRALARIAEIHERRLSRIEGEDEQE